MLFNKKKYSRKRMEKFCFQEKFKTHFKNDEGKKSQRSKKGQTHEMNGKRAKQTTTKIYANTQK